MRIAKLGGMSYNAAVWQDHNQTKLFNVPPDSFDTETVHSHAEHTKIHRRSGPGAESGHRAPEDPRYYHEISRALEGAEEILVVGPSTAKLVLLKHVHKHDPSIAARIVGVETVDHPSDRQLVAFVRQY